MGSLSRAILYYIWLIITHYESACALLNLLLTGIITTKIFFKHGIRGTKYLLRYTENNLVCRFAGVVLAI